MYKIFTVFICGSYSCVKPKIIWIMRLSYLFCLLSFMQVSAKSIAQKININKTNAPLKEVLNDIGKQTKYSIFYDVDLIKIAKPVTLKVENSSLEETLKKCFSDQPFDYKINDKTILVIPKAGGSSSPKRIPSAIVNYITGKVVNERNEPLIGVNVREKNATASAATNGDGVFKIGVRDQNSILIFSFIGHEVQELSVPKNGLMTVVLKEQSTGLNDVVVVGYGVTKKRDLTGSVSSVKQKDLENQLTPNVLTALQDKCLVWMLDKVMAHQVPTRSSGFGVLDLLEGVELVMRRYMLWTVFL